MQRPGIGPLSFPWRPASGRCDRGPSVIRAVVVKGKNVLKTIATLAMAETRAHIRHLLAYESERQRTAEGVRDLRTYLSEEWRP